MVKDIDSDNASSARQVPRHINDGEPAMKYRQFLGAVMVLGFLIIGSAAGSYGIFQDLMEAPCLGCLGLYPSFEIEFTFNTVDGRPHPEFVLDALDEGPVFIEFTQNDENCPPCARMRPKVAELEEKYRNEVTFMIININEHEIRTMFKESDETTSSYEEEKSFRVYDVGNIAGGTTATPTYIIVTIEKDDSGNVRPFFATGYGEFKEENAEKTKQELAEVLDFAIVRYEYNEKQYHSD